MLWLVSVTHQAVSRNSRILTTSNGFLNAGSDTEMVLYEAAAHGLASVVSGGDLWETAQECYNVRTARPLPWYLDMYKKVKDEVAAMGVAFLY